MKTKLIRMVTSDNLRFDGLLYEPENKTNKVVIHVHGTSSDFYRTEYFETMSEKYTNAGYAFLTFNNRGSGREYHFKTVKDGKIGPSVEIGSRNEIFEDCEIDIQAAIDFVKTKGLHEIVLQGHSYGCNKVIWYTLENDFCGKIILLAPCDIYNQALKKSAIERKARDVNNVDMFRYRDNVVSPKLAKITNDLLVEIGTVDKYIRCDDVHGCIDYLQRAFSNSKVTGHLIENANHNFNGCEEKLVENLIEWLAR